MNYLKVTFEFISKFLAFYTIYCLNENSIKELYSKIYNNIFSFLVFFCFFITLFNKKCAH
jgi:hypothetical protein